MGVATGPAVTVGGGGVVVAMSAVCEWSVVVVASRHRHGDRDSSRCDRDEQRTNQSHTGIPRGGRARVELASATSQSAGSHKEALEASALPSRRRVGCDHRRRGHRCSRLRHPGLRSIVVGSRRKCGSHAAARTGSRREMPRQRQRTAMGEKRVASSAAVENALRGWRPSRDARPAQALRRPPD